MKSVRQIFRKLRHPSNRQVLFVGLVCWFLVGWLWIIFTDNVELAGTPTTGTLFSIMCLTVMTLSSAYIVYQGFLFCNKIANRNESVISTLLILPTMALVDFLASWLSMLLWYGPHGKLDSVAPLSSPSLILVNTPLGYASRIVGFYGLAAFFWAVLFMIAKPKLRKMIPVVILPLFMLAVAGHILYKSTNGQTITATIIHEKIDQHVPVVNTKSTNLVVFPEYGFDYIPEKNPNKRLEPTTRTDKVYYIGSRSLTIFGIDGHRNQQVFGNNHEGPTLIQDKYRLIPGGEDLSFTLRAILLLTRQRAALDYFTSARGVIAGNEKLHPLLVNDKIIVGSTICSSIISPEDYRIQSNEGATILTNSASLEIFEGSPTFEWQQKSMAKFMAIANSRPFLQSANNGLSFTLDNNGKTINELDSIGTTESIIKSNSTKTVYTLLGEWVVYLGLFACIWFMYDSKFKINKKTLKRSRRNDKK